jgi:hypothetical protein
MLRLCLPRHLLPHCSRHRSAGRRAGRPRVDAAAERAKTSLDKEERREFLRLQEPPRRGQGAQANPQMGCDGRIRARQPKAGRCARSLQHWQGGLGGQRLPLGADSGGPEGEGLAEPYPPARRTQSTAVRAPEVGEYDALEGTGRAEHIFGQQQSSMGGKIVRTIGIVRARFKIGMMNLGYNIRRLVQLERMAPAPLDCAHGWRLCGIVQSTAQSPAGQNGPRTPNTGIVRGPQ